MGSTVTNTVNAYQELTDLFSPLSFLFISFFKIMEVVSVT